MGRATSRLRSVHLAKSLQACSFHLVISNAFEAGFELDGNVEAFEEARFAFNLLLSR